MARQSREDAPNTWHHVMNRGIARRPLFEDRADIRYFLSRLAREVRKGRIEVHCWCIMTTHYHLLIRSPTGELSAAIRNIQNAYSRYFNRRHKRDGSLIRGRFTSTRVHSMTYRRLLIGYINRNPMTAGMATIPQDYPFGSAYQWASQRIPKWLNQDWVTANFATTTTSTEACALVESRFNNPSKGADELDSLINAAPGSIQTWLQRKAALADGMSIGQPVCDRSSVLFALAQVKEEDTATLALLAFMGESMQVGLLRSLVRLPWKEIAEPLQIGTTSCTRQFTLHKKRLNENATYARVTALLAKAALDYCHRRPALHGK